MLKRGGILLVLVILISVSVTGAFADSLFHATFVDSFVITGDIPLGFAFSSDGTKMFVTGQNQDAVFEYTLSTAFDVSTAAFVDSFPVAAQDTTSADLAFNSDGTKMFVVGLVGRDINEYTLSSAFDLSSTVTFVDSFSVAAQGANPFSLAFSSDGTKMFVVDTGGKKVSEYALSSAFDLSSTVTFVDSFSVAAQENNVLGVAFNSDGTKMFVVGLVEDAVFKYTLSSAFDLSSTVTFVDSFSVAAQDLNPRDIEFSSDGTKMFVLGASGNDINEYNITPSCIVLSGDWTVTSSCILTADATVTGNVLVQNNSVLIVPSGVTLDINFASFNLTVESGGGVLIKSGGTIT